MSTCKKNTLTYQECTAHQPNVAWWHQMMPWKVWSNIGSGNGLVPGGTKSLLESRKLRSHWLKLLQQGHVTVVIQGPGTQCLAADIDTFVQKNSIAKALEFYYCCFNQLIFSWLSYSFNIFSTLPRVIRWWSTFYSVVICTLEHLPVALLCIPYWWSFGIWYSRME